MPIMEVNGEFTFKESRMRSLMKTLVYRITSIFGTGILTWIITKDIQETISIILMIQVFLLVLYYSYERIWDGINWGGSTKIT
ncbi:DUF2061 domain-containing protein [Chloroflexota bacterium]